MSKRIVRAGRRTTGVVGSALVVVVAGAAQGAAQERPIEFGVDGGIVHVRFDGRETAGVSVPGSEATGFVFPTAGIHMGFWLSERAALDLSGQVSVQRYEIGDTDETTTSSSISLLPGLVWHFADAGRHNQPYVRGEAGFRFASQSNNDSATQVQAGLAAGVKVPIASTAFLRFEAGYRRQFDTDRLRGIQEFRLGTGLVAVIN